MEIKENLRLHFYEKFGAREEPEKFGTRVGHKNLAPAIARQMVNRLVSLGRQIFCAPLGCQIFRSQMLNSFLITSVVACDFSPAIINEVEVKSTNGSNIINNSFIHCVLFQSFILHGFGAKL